MYSSESIPHAPLNCAKCHACKVGTHISAKRYITIVGQFSQASQTTFCSTTRSRRHEKSYNRSCTQSSTEKQSLVQRVRDFSVKNVKNLEIRYTDQ